MGNFSRDTFDPSNRYVAVRMQQGVPILDSDWNEMNDVIRQELHDGLRIACADGVRGGSWHVGPTLGGLVPNEFGVMTGMAMIRGRPLFLLTSDPISYSRQPWTDPKRAAKDKVDPIAPLTTPTEDRTDVVYLDVWDREVDGAEDPDLINKAIGIETSLRLKREVAVRVHEGHRWPPEEPPGHSFLSLALLRRRAGEEGITREQIQDIRPFLLEDIRPFLQGLRDPREVSFLPAFLPVSLVSGEALMPAWRLHPLVLKFEARKLYNESAHGLLPLTLPDGAYMNYLKIRGYTEGVVRFSLVRINHRVAARTPGTELRDELLHLTLQPTGGSTELEFARSFAIPTLNGQNVVDNSRYYYGLQAETDSAPYSTYIAGISVHYNY